MIGFMLCSVIFWLSHDVSEYRQQEANLVSQTAQIEKLQKYLVDRPPVQADQEEEMTETLSRLLAEKLTVISLQNNDLDSGFSYSLTGNYLDLLRFLKSYSALEQGFLIKGLQVAYEKEFLQIELVFQRYLVEIGA